MCTEQMMTMSGPRRMMKMNRQLGETSSSSRERNMVAAERKRRPCRAGNTTTISGLNSEEIGDVFLLTAPGVVSRVDVVAVHLEAKKVAEVGVVVPSRAIFGEFNNRKTMLKLESRAVRKCGAREEKNM